MPDRKPDIAGALAAVARAEFELAAMKIAEDRGDARAVAMRLASIGQALNVAARAVGLPELTPTPDGKRCSRCGNTTNGQREGGVDYCTTCGGIL